MTFIDSIQNKYISNNQQEALHHVEAVAEIAVGLAKTYNLDLEKIKLAALLHDISAIMTPQEMYTLAKNAGWKLTLRKKNTMLCCIKEFLQSLHKRILKSPIPIF